MAEMISIRITILGKSYQLKVLPGDEQMMQDIADYVNNRFRDYRKELQGQNEATISALATLSIAEDLFLEKRNPQTTSGNQQETQQRIQKLLADIKVINADISNS